MITLQDLAVTINGGIVLGPFTGQFRAGTITAVLGPNGAGKTTMLRALLGLVASAGTIMLDGIPLAALSAKARARKLGYLPQFGSPAWNLIAQDVVMLGRAPHRGRHAAPSAADIAAVRDALAMCDASRFALRPVLSLSGGECARVLLARILATLPDWLLIDEPLNHLDPLHQRNLLNLLRQQAASGVGVIVVLHDLNAAAQIADDVVLLRDGRQVAQGLATDVLTPANLAMAYDVVFDIDLARGRIEYAR
jgi:iron complex transport system ATP-binding protein